MNTLRLFARACCFLLLAGFARAHVTFPFGSMDIPLGEELTYYIVADVEEENATMYSFVSNTDPTVAEVKAPLNFSQKEFGSWSIKALKLGTTTLTFHWKYKRDRSGNEGDQDEVIVVNVVPPGTRTAANPWAITIADPVNSRSGGFENDEPVGLALGGPQPLEFGVSYDSQRVAEGIAAGAMGANRRHNFEWKLEVEAQYFGVETKSLAVKVTTDRGRVVRFSRRTTADKWTQVGRTDTVFGLMEEEGIFYFFTLASQRVLVFDANGKLTKIIDGRGNTHALSYAGNTLTGVADGLGRTLAFTTTSGRITRVTDHTGRHVDFAYTGVNMTSATDPLGHATTFAYDGAGLLTSFTRPEGNVPFTQVFTAGKVTSQTERTADTTMIAYAAGETTITQPGGATMRHRYAPTGELTGYTDEGGNDVEMTSDATGRRNGVMDREGDATGITYHAPSGLPATITNAEGRVTTMTYKPRLLRLDGVTDKLKALTFFDLAKIVFADGTSETFSYDARGNMTSRTDRAGKKWTATHNDRGQPLTMTNPTGGTATFAYDEAGNLASSKDSATGTTTYAYDTLSRLTTITRPGGATRTFIYDDADRLASTTDERAKTTSFDYDDNDRLTEITDPDTNETQLGYDVLDRVTQVTDRLMKVSSRTFDARRLLATVTDRNNNVTTLGYDDRQRPITVTDPGGQTWTFGFDDEGLLTSATDPVNPAAQFRRNALGRVTDVSNELGQTARVARDAMQRVTQSFDALGRATTFTYDKRGDLTGVSEEGSGAAKFTRDALGNVTAIAAPNGGVWRTTYTAEGRVQAMTDPLGNSWQRTYDTRGRLATLAFPDAASATFTYDGASNVTRALFSDGHDLNFTYDNLGRLITATDPSVASFGTGNSVQFTYDAESRLTATTYPGTPAKTFGATYDDGGRLKTVVYGVGGANYTITYTYDTRDRLTRVDDGTNSVDFGYDDAGRLLTMTRSNARHATFTRDDAGRLTRIQDGTAMDFKYMLNAAGDVISEDQTGGVVPSLAAETTQFAFDKAAQIATAGYAYDNRGRLTAMPGHTFEWDDASRLARIDTLDLHRNALGKIFNWDGSPRLHHFAIAGAPLVMNDLIFYVWTPDGRLLWRIDPSGTGFYHFDRIGSTIEITNGAGNQIALFGYTPYGEMLPGSSGSELFTFVGQYGVRAEEELYEMGARYYDPASERFLTRDPIPPRLGDVRSLNPYAYANQNPLRYVDPAGSIVEEGTGNAYGGGGAIGGWLFLLVSLAPEGAEALGEGTEFFEGAFRRVDRDKYRDAKGSTVPPPGVSPITLTAPVQPMKKPRSRLEIVNATAAKFGGSAHSTAGGMVRGALSVNRNGGFKTAENESPRPQHRVFLNYNYFNNVTPAGPGVPLNRSVVGFEQTFLDESSSFGVRLPFAAGPVPRPNDGYNFILEAGSDGKVLGGTYATDSLEPHPDFLWAPLR